MNDFLGGHIDMVTVTTSTALSLSGRAVPVVNASDLDYPKKAAKGEVANANSLGLKPYSPPRFIAMHPDTPDDQLAAMSAKLGELLKAKSVKKLIGKLGEVIVYLPHDKAAPAYAEVLENAKANLGLFR